MTANHPTTILCLASEHKGDAFIRECKQQGARVLLLTEAKWADKPWPMASIDERFLMPDLSQRQDIINAVSYLARTRHIDRIVALDDYDVGTAAALREHLRMPGMGDTTARHFRDKLAMRARAQEAGILVPEFSGILNYDDLRAYMERVPAPWVLKPRFEAGALGIQKIHDSETLWRTLASLGDQQSFYLLEKFVPGDVYHVDSLVWEGEYLFGISSRYGRPPLNVAHEGGVFSTCTLASDSDEAQTLRGATENLMSALGLVRGVSHTEFIRAQADGRFYFLETAARVGGANIADLVDQTSGLNPWAEWARIELAHARGEEYRLPEIRQNSGGLLVCLARQHQPDLSAYNDPEVAWRLDKEYHAGLILVSSDAARVEALLEDYAQRFARDFLVVQPPQKATRTQT
jgi:biotin carboxylase